MSTLFPRNLYLLFICWVHLLDQFAVEATSGSALNRLEDVVFPPEFLLSSDPDIPAGHLQMFGLQRPPKAPVVQYNTVLKPQEFWEKHVSKYEPLVFRGALANSPALQKWTDEYLKEKYGDLDVLTELKTENRTHGITARMLLGDFIDVYKKKNLYVVTVLPDPMRQDLPLLPCLMCGTFKDFIHELNFWMSSGGTRSVIHFDADHNIHCIVAGRKDFMMIDPDFAPFLNLTKPPQFGSGFSSINPDVVDLNLYPDVSKVEWTYSTLEPGDCIFIPSGYIHQVRSYKGNRTISATMLFTASLDDTFDNSSCENETYEYRALSQAKVHWTYNKGDKTIDMGYQNVERFRQTLLSAFEELKADTLTEEQFSVIIEDLFELDEEDVEDMQRDTLEIFHELLDPEGKGFITRDDIKALSQDTLKQIARRSEAPHGPVAGAPGDLGGASKLRMDSKAETGQDTENERRDEL
ncbi:uncharacterized protein LOC110068214 [Orbicella faveolata]|uniref:uncharacterized protein LOC110068214 n=1 Tax=Orbicella faveolata TaxID=48498 RepID=UPI0009E55CD7|nr:uncharacterized protein LOC110068214 [Orbicella faveolata]